jgi:hypothetical protein
LQIRHTQSIPQKESFRFDTFYQFFLKSSANSENSDHNGKFCSWAKWIFLYFIFLLWLLWHVLFAFLPIAGYDFVVVYSGQKMVKFMRVNSKNPKPLESANELNRQMTMNFAYPSLPKYNNI